MQTDELTDNALALPVRARLELAAELLASIRQPLDVPAIVAAAEQACGIKMDNTYRGPAYVDARSIIAYAMHRAGVADRDIAKVINKDRATVIYMRRKLGDALAFPAGNLGLVSRFAEFNKLLLCD